MSARKAFSLLEVAVAAGVLLTLAVPVAGMLSAGNRSTAMATEELRAALLATEVLEAVETLAGTAYASQEKPLPGTDGWRWSAKPPGTGRGLEEGAWADLDRAMEEEGNGFPLDSRDFEASRLFLAPAPEGYRRYLRVELPPAYELGPDPLVLRVRCLVRYRVALGGRLQEKTLTLSTLLITEDPLARLDG